MPGLLTRKNRVYRRRRTKIEASAVKTVESTTACRPRELCAKSDNIVLLRRVCEEDGKNSPRTTLSKGPVCERSTGMACVAWIKSEVKMVWCASTKFPDELPVTCQCAEIGISTFRKSATFAERAPSMRVRLGIYAFLVRCALYRYKLAAHAACWSRLAYL